MKTINQAAQEIIALCSGRGLNQQQFEQGSAILAEIGLPGMGIWTGETHDMMDPDNEDCCAYRATHRFIGLTFKKERERTPLKLEQFETLHALVSKIAETHNIHLKMLFGVVGKIGTTVHR